MINRHECLKACIGKNFKRSVKRTRQDMEQTCLAGKSYFVKTETPVS